MLSEPVTHHTFLLRATPLAEPGQEPMRVSLTCKPGCRLAEGIDAQGNFVYQGNIEEKHTFFSFCSTGEVAVNARLQNLSECPPYYRFATPLTELKGELAEYFFANRLAAGALECAEHWMTKLKTDFHYEKGVTTTETSASEAWNLGSGVCQDFAHLLLTLLRAQGFGCRYVAGLMVGEGASHAWVEVFDGKGWVGVDPTHSRFCNENYVKISRGPDFSYCALERGVFLGTAEQTMHSRCSLVEIG